MPSMWHLRKNKYDDEVVEYWVDYHTHGTKGSEERDGIRDKASTRGLADATALQATPLDGWDLSVAGACEIEKGTDVPWV